MCLRFQGVRLLRKRNRGSEVNSLARVRQNAKLPLLQGSDLQTWTDDNFGETVAGLGFANRAASFYLQVGELELRTKNHQAYLWQYGRPGGSVVFDFRLGRGLDGPKQFLGQFEGILQTDGYTAYDQIGGTRMVHAACWAHARRQFFEAVQRNSTGG